MVIMVMIVVVVVIVSVLAGPVVPSVGEVSAGASENISACTNHVGGEGKLLAVKDEDSSVVVASRLGGSALSLEVLDSVLLIRDLAIIVMDLTIVVIDAVVVLRDAAVVVADA